MQAHNDHVGRLVHALLMQAHHLGFWSYVLLGLLVTVEGPIATILGAAAASTGALSPGGVFVSAFVGNLCGDLLWYLLGSLGKTEWLIAHAHWMRLDQSVVERMADKMRENAPRIIFVAKLTLFFTIPVLLAAGITRASLRRWLPLDACAEVIWTGALVTSGYFLARYLTGVERGVQIVSTVGFFIFLLAGMACVRRFGAGWAAQSA